MATIVSGPSLGLSLTSRALFGPPAGMPESAGAGRETAAVNATTGNLVLQQQDDRLVGRGGGSAALRTYNSQGRLDDDNGDNWSVGVQAQRLRLVGTLNAAGSRFVRTDRDGAESVYAWDAVRGLYVSSDGDGAHDTVAFDPALSRHVRTDGSTGWQEQHDVVDGRLLATADTAGNATRYAYGPGGLLASVTHADGEQTLYDYSGRDLVQVRTVVDGGLGTLTRVRYAYDASHRLASVIVDLSPADGSVADGRCFVTTYGYDGDSTRLVSVGRSDGTGMTLAYALVGTTHRVAAVTDALGRRTTFAYDPAALTTTVTDALNRTTVYGHDAAGQLVRIVAPAAGGASGVTTFAYDAAGNRVRVTDPLGRSTDTVFDAMGNATLQRDATGATVARTFDARNRMLTETAYALVDPDGEGPAQPAAPQVTRHVHDAAARHGLRFVVSPEGRVTEHRYDARGDRIATLHYAAAAYPVAGLPADQALAEGQLVAWAATQDGTRVQRTDFAYDTRGQLQRETRYARTDAAGTGVADGSESVTHHVHDRSGLLLQTVSATGGVTTWTHDGLGRVLTHTDPLGQVTATTYDDAGQRTQTVFAGGLVTTRVLDRAGQLAWESHADGQGVLLGETRYHHDAAGRLVMTRDATGARRWMLYDDAGRQVADIDDNGSFTEYVHDAAGRLTHTVAYAVAAQTGLLADASGNPLQPALAAVRPAASASDARTWRAYDAAGRLVKTVSPLGAVTETVYDGAGRAVQTIARANLVATTLGPAPSPADIAPAANAASDRVTRRFHDDDGHLVATLDGEGYLTENQHDAAGRLVLTVRYAARTASTLWASGTLAQLRPAAHAADIRQVVLYDGHGRAVGLVDGENHLTEKRYDGHGNLTQVVRYATRLAGVVSPSATLAAIRPAVMPQDQVTRWRHDALHRVVEHVDPAGTVTLHRYDAAGRLVATTTGAGEADARTRLVRHDLLGRTVAELSGEGAARLAAAASAAQVEAVWAQHAVRHTVDAAGRRTASTDANGHRTLHYYAGDGLLRYTVNALGEVEEHQYNALNRRTATIRYGTRIATAGLVGGAVTGGLTNAVNAVRNAALDSRTTTAYLRDGSVSAVTDATGHVVSHGYNAFGERSSTVVALGGGATTRDAFGYDRRGLQRVHASDTAGVNASVSKVLDAFGRVTSWSDANGGVHTQAFDRLGRIVRTKDPASPARTTSYDAFDRVLVHTDAQGAVTRYHHDDATRETTVTTPEGIVTVSRRNAHGQTIRLRDGLGATTEYRYDLDGALTEQVDASGVLDRTTRSAYDRAGRTLETTDANGVRTTYAYDAANRLLTRTLDPGGLNLQTSYQYDAKGQRVRETDAGGVVTTLAYDLKGQVVRRTVDASGLALETVYTHDGRGEVLTVRDPGGTVTRYAYDGLGRRTHETLDPGGLDLTRRYTYDKKGNVLSRVDATGHATRYAYDADDRLTHAVDPAGGVTRTEYDGEGRVKRVTRHALPIALAGLPLPATAAQVQALVVADAAHDEVETRRLDRDGRVRFTVDGTGGVVEFRRDARGNVVERIHYAKPIHLAAWNGTTDPPVAPDALDRRTRTVYDALGRITHAADATGAVTRHRYDAHGNEVERIRFATPVAAGASPAAVVASAHDRVEVFRHDAAHRRTWQANAVGAVTHSEHDASGRVVRITAYAALVAPGSEPGSVVADALADRVERRVHDAAGRLLFAVDPEGGVTAYRHDAAGREVGRTEYALAIDLSAVAAQATADDVASRLVPQPADDRTIRTVRDAAGRAVYEIDGEGYVSRTVHDGAGRVVRVQRFENAVSLSSSTPTAAEVSAALGASTFTAVLQVHDAAGRLVESIDEIGVATRRDYDGAGRLLRRVEAAGLPEQRITEHRHDASGRLLGTTVAAGTDAAATTLYRYDAFGDVVAEVDPRGVALAGENSAWAVAQRVRLGHAADAASLGAAQRQALLDAHTARHEYDAAGRRIRTTSAIGGATTTHHDAFGNAVKVVDPRGHAAHFHFDKLDRVTLQVDPAGHVIETVYAGSFGDQVQSVRRYFQRVAAAPIGSAQPVPTPDPLRDAVTSYRHDRLGRVTRSTDAAGAVETIVHAVSGNRFARQVANKAGGVATYAYDRRGLQVVETLPVQSRDAAGALRPVVNVYRHDAWGRRVETIEARGLPEQRTTTWRHDAAGRVTHRIGMAYTALDALTGASATVTPVEVTRRDALGQVVESVTGARWDGTSAVGGAGTRRYLDAGGRLVATLGPDGALVRYDVDPAGAVWRETAHAQRVAIPAAGDAPPVAAPDPANDRVTTSIRDAAGRVLETRREAVVHWEQPAGSDAITLALPGGGPEAVTLQKLAYDANGNVVQETDGRGHGVFSYFDTLGRKVLRIDAEGYAVAWDYEDLHDTPTQEVRYAGRVAQYARQDDASAAPASRDPALLRQGLSAVDARIVRTAADRLGRITEQRTLGVAFQHVGPDGTLARGIADALTTYAYDGLGNVTRERQRVATLADGADVWNVTDIAYDALGREVSRQAPGFVDHRGVAVRPRTDLQYDGLGQVSRSLQRGDDGASEADDRITVHRYDANGQRVETVDAEGHVTVHELDAQGRVARRTVLAVRDADGGTRNVSTVFEYDPAGRITAQTDVETGEVRRSRYNAFGEISGKGLGDGWQEFFEYSTLGQVQKTNSGDGVVRIHLHDQAGNATRRIESATVDLTGVSVVAAAHDATLLHTFSSHDRRGHLVKTVEPDISYLRDQVSMSQAFTQKLADLYGAIAVAPSTGGAYAGGTVDATGHAYTQVSGSGNASPMPPPATAAAGIDRRYEAPPPLRTALHTAGATAFPVAWGGSGVYTTRSTSRNIQFQVPSHLPALTYRITSGTGAVALTGPLVPGQFTPLSGNGTFLLQVQLGTGHYYTISTLRTQTSVEPIYSGTYLLEQHWSSTEPRAFWIPPGNAAGPYSAVVGDDTASPVSLPVDNPGGGWLFVNAESLAPGTHRVTLRSHDAGGNPVGEVVTVSLGDGATIVDRAALADPDVRVTCSATTAQRVLWFNGSAIGGTAGLIHLRPAGSTADWSAHTFGGANVDIATFGLQVGAAYEFIVDTGVKESYGQFTLDAGGVPLLAHDGMLQAVSRAPRTLDFDVAGRLAATTAPAYLMELRIGGLTVAKPLDGWRASFDVGGELAALGVSHYANQAFTYDYRVYGLQGGIRQFVGQGGGAVRLGSDFVAVPAGTQARQPVALLSLPAGATLAGALSVKPHDSATAVAVAAGDWRRTAPDDSTVGVDLSQWFTFGAAARLIDLSYSAGDAVFRGTYRLDGDGGVACLSFSSSQREPKIPITVAGSTRLAMLKVGADDTSLAAVAAARWTTSGSTFTWDASDQAGRGARRFYYEATDASGHVVGKGYGSFTLATDGTLTHAMDAPLLRPSTFRFTPPANTATFELQVRPKGSTGAWVVHPDLPVDGSGRLFDATALRPLSGTAEHECRHVARDAAGVVVGSGSGVLVIEASGATSATLSEDRRPTVVTLHGPAGRSVARLLLETKPYGSTGPSASAVLAGTWDASLGRTVFSWQVTVDRTVEYDYTLRMQNADGSAYRNEVGDPIEVKGVMTLGAGTSTPVVMRQYVTQLQQAAQVRRLQEHNAFGEVAAEYDDRVLQRAQAMVALHGGTADASAAKTTFAYDTLGRLLARTEPQTHVTLADGTRHRVRPLTRYGHDLAGRTTTVTDANGHVGRQAYNGAGESLAAQWAADGGKKAWAYDAFGGLRRTTDELGAVTLHETDRLGNVVQVRRLGIARVENFTDANAVAPLLSQTYEHDAFGRRIRHVDALGFVHKTFYDSLGRVTAGVTAENRSTRTRHAFVAAGTVDGILGAGGRNVGGWRVTTTGPDGRATVDQTDYFGRTTGHRDLGGRTYAYRYDLGGRLASQTSSAGQNIEYGYYANGYIREAKDLAERTLSRYGYDNAGNRTWEAYSALDPTGTLPVASYQESTIAYDELNRMSRVKDLAVDVQYEYDAVGNRRAVHAVYWDPTTLGTRRRDDFWYAYDAANRFTITKGAFTGTRGAGSIVKGPHGMQIAYDAAGQRRSATDAAGQVESYAYSADGYLEDVRIDGALRARRRVDAGGRTLQYKEWAADGSERLARTTTYDRDNRVVRDITDDGTTEHFYFTGTADDPATAAASGSGALARTRFTPSSAGTAVTTTYGYEYWDSARQSTISEQAANDSVPDWAPGFSRFAYDVNGYLDMAHDLAAGRTMRYFTNATGLVLRRDESKGAQSYTHHWYYAAGRRIGDVTTDPNDGFRASYAETLAAQESVRITSSPEEDSMLGAVASAVTQGSRRRAGDANERFRHFRPVTSADFDQSYEPIGPAYPAAVGSSYTVRHGDTLKSIAQALWGDSAMWFLIAESNALSGSESLAAGQVLVIPNKVANIHNSAETFRPYSPGEVIGDVDPTLPTPLPPARDDCGGLGTVIVIVVAVVVTAVTAGAATPLVGAMLPAGTATAMGGGAVGAAAGSIASQAVGMVIGTVDRFSWKSVGASAFAGAIGGGVGRLATTLSNGSGWMAGALKAQSTVRAAFTAGAATAVSQALRGHWNWREVAASAVGAAAGEAAGARFDEALDGKGGSDFGSLASKVTRGMAGSWAASAVLATDGGYARARTGEMFVGALGGALGNVLEQELIGSAYGTTFAEDVAVRKALHDPYGLSGGRADGPRPGSVELDPDELRQRWRETGIKPLYDFGDPLEVAGDVLAAANGARIGRPGTRAAIDVSVNRRTAEILGILSDADALGLVPQAYRDIKQIAPMLAEAARQDALAKVQDALRDRLGMRVMPTPEDLGAVRGLYADGSQRFDTSDLLDRYSDALRKVGLAQSQVIELDYRSFEVKTVGSQKLTPQQYISQIEDRYQRAFATGVEIAERQYDAGKLRYPQDMPKQLQIGLFADNVAREALVRYNTAIAVPEGPGQLISLNRWAYDMKGSGQYVRPDVFVDFGPDRRYWIDGKTTLVEESSTKQFDSFYRYTGAIAGKVATPQGITPIAQHRIKLGR